ncbi:M20/M25/M40 family metallo-hydrolase [Sedimentibacter saalensis]|uniref:M20/M25/M40 family metallo-hydrolase n=1 Tax=Sedimentibacter saalensis TaxID=130788 RepID=UPI002896F4A7|nr:M20/M25/M40 family metallo-hydrolase [Sedimentibacter saalensis]
MDFIKERILENVQVLLKNEKVLKAIEFIKEDDDRTLKEHLELCEIPAPSHDEERRAIYVKNKFEEIGLDDIKIDEVWNVMGTIPGTGNGPVIMLAAHTDTVFPIETDLKVRKEGNVYYCPGINDDTRAVAELFTIARAMKTFGIKAQGDIVFCANVCEEGLGDLKGVKHIFEYQNSIDAFVSIDNPVTGGIVYTATGSHRYQVTFSGCGGHSFADFGLPNPIHAMGRAINMIAQFQVPKIPKTTFNVGIVEGGTSVNTISASCSMLVDIRSDSSEELNRLSLELKKAVDLAVQEENKRWESSENVAAEIIMKGNRPAGTQPKDCTIVKTAWEAAELLGIEPELRDESSTDANIPISMGIPAITVGRGGKEGKVHTIHEWFEPADAFLGPQKDLLLILGLAGLDGCLEHRIKKL